jgi:two-component system, chemotaxis family, response regulator WspF
VILVAIGSSAGGPAALATILAALPADFPAAIVIIQHLDPQMAAGMASWLAGQCTLPLTIAAAGDVPERGRVLLAASNDHLVLQPSGRLAYTPEPRETVHRPSVDVFFESVSSHWRDRAVGVLLTGMGRDGAQGLRTLRDAGHHTIAQDRDSSAVYGMPKAAAALDAAVDILPVTRIAPRLIRLVQQQVQ